VTRLSRQLREDKALRDAALALVKADLAHLRGDLTGKSLGARFVDRMSEGAVDVFEDAVEVADDHKGVLATLLAAVVLWFARNPILSLFDDRDDDDEDAAADGEYEEYPGAPEQEGR